MKKMIQKIQHKKAKLLGAGISAVICACMPAIYAFAADSSGNSGMFESVKGYLQSGIAGLGAILAIFGIVNLGLTIKDGMQGGGGQLSGAIAMIIGGAMIVVASVLFSSVTV